MSRVGKKPILIPEGVEVKIEGQQISIKGPKGELSREIRPEIKVEIKGKEIFVSPQIPSFRKAKAKVEKKETSSIETKKTKAFWGTTRALLANMIKGVKEGYERKLEIEGLGFKASVESGAPENLILYVGFSHPVKIKAPKDIKFLVEKNVITVSGIDKELVGQIAAKIRKVKPPEPYKGKGIRYLGEQIRRKVGKRVVAAPK
ncbi:50S ribosomal protein L6 [bacterium]|uniref:Large ribosomal subunit protein uL6 n=4 Tax=Candidatus Nealsoniibacteriota TaxID=1817911 RepID=A0A2M7EBV7_9BACT|nr:50S ribosomal protein L6 [bacterium]PIV65189.1 MAG: 50S ribosomal protein L6 [Candidatus Nealsonbacteria bacterium CG01_land_8_20_14_3_00_12]PIW35061.1 MAG: 50S ribosomal protein L6 [Candidatus Nealsonbacteria bacterium CG15_BIG_FIL_POST_REV_8_21_14_020_37_12]PIW91450.1 MAG: 50S ribosomal protein L6 [Candidatus Nealsonbacteria bacterium CG_4_8_14_3_um_filter_37_36]PJA83932.1 MAG: 50S ribosomal protein L6 [Candidatus Nealsonbacteria bacterium CG_4_9_14_3_um_filter_37_29]